jgi:putative N6-adenine-specific DNA methylase
VAVAAFAVTAPGVESLAADELAAAGIAGAQAQAGGVAFEATDPVLARALIHTRLSTRIIVRVAEFRATTFAQLEARSKGIPWETLLPAGAPAALRVTCRKSRLYHSGAVAERIGGAIESRVRGAHVAVSASGDDATASQLVVVRMSRDICHISVDAAGTPLYKRGYREATAKAPIRETLAAALLAAAGWEGGSAVMDPFCGSGTLVIEAALRARRIAPGTMRTFIAETWPSASARTWEDERSAARDHARAAAEIPLVGRDRDDGAIQAATANALRAGVADDVEFHAGAVSAATPPAAHGLLVTNPPYGIRVAPSQDLRNLYASFGRVVRDRFAGWQCAVLFTDDAHGRALERQFALPVVPALRTMNGGVPVRLMVSAASRLANDAR